MLGLIRTGLRRGLAAPGAVLLLMLLNLLLALPAALTLHQEIRDDLGNQLVQRDLLEGFDMAWHREFREGASAIGRTFDPGLIRGGAFFRNWDDLLSGRLFKRPALLLGCGVMFGLVWLTISGGLIRRFADDRFAEKPAGLIRDGGLYLARFVRLTLFSAPFYVLIFVMHARLYRRLGRVTIDATSELSVFGQTLGVVGLTALLLTVVHLAMRYAKIATVVEQRRRMFLTMFRGFGFVFLHPLQVAGLFLMFWAIQVGLVLLLHPIAPGIGQRSSTAILLAFLLMQLLLLLQMFLRVGRLAAETRLFCDAADSRRSIGSEPAA